MILAQLNACFLASISFNIEQFYGMHSPELNQEA